MSEQGEDVTVADAPERSRFEITVDGKLAGFADYQQRPGVIAVIHSEIDDAFQGRGLAGRLTRTVLDTIRERGLQVIPLCPYTANFIRRHPGYLDLVDPQHRAELSEAG